MIMKEDLYNNDDRHYLQMLQDVINRMANNSANCKTWMITLVSALTALQISMNALKQYVWIALVPIALFWLLDCYYLGMGRRFIKLEREFIDGNGHCYDFNISKYGCHLCNTVYAIFSFSTTPLYSMFALIVCVIKWCI